MTREQQIELMKECVSDAEVCLAAAHDPLMLPAHQVLTLAVAFFEYRTRQRGLADALRAARQESGRHETDVPCSSTDKTPDLEED